MQKLLFAIAVLLLLCNTVPSYALDRVDMARACLANPTCSLLFKNATTVGLGIGQSIFQCGTGQVGCTIWPKRTNSISAAGVERRWVPDPRYADLVRQTLPPGFGN